MRLLSCLLTVICLVGCTTFGSNKTTSGWFALDHAQEVDCGTWPQRESDLQIDELLAVRGRAAGFLVTGTKRDATPFHYYAPFAGEIKPDPTEFSPLSLGLGSVFLGAATVNGQDVAVTAHNLTQKSQLELRTVKGNILKFQEDLAVFNIVEGSAIPDQDGVWLILQGDDNAYHVAYVALEKGKKAAIRLNKDIALANAPRVLPQPGKKAALVLWKEGDTGKPLQARVAHADGSTEPAVILDIPVTQLESWTAATSPEGTYLAMVDGDTLIGQAEVKVARVYADDTGIDVKGLATSKLSDTHATEPVLYAGHRGLELLLLNWIDEESTIARYMVAGDSLGKPSYSGIFPKGTRIMAAFAETGGEGSYVLTRHRNDTRWVFRVCELKDP